MVYVGNTVFIIYIFLFVVRWLAIHQNNRCVFDVKLCDFGKVCIILQTVGDISVSMNKEIDDV